ncbi:hypothetical protein HPB47_003691, partial [Ixodes persulcatus]
TGNPIPRVDVLRVPGMLIESNGCNPRTINKSTTKTENIIRLISRVSSRRGATFTYVEAMYCWLGHEKLNRLIQKSIKMVLGIPRQASSERLMQPGFHNTLEEITEAQESAQVARLSSSPAGRRILAVLGLNITLVAERRHLLSDAQGPSIQASPFSRTAPLAGKKKSRLLAGRGHVQFEARDERKSRCRATPPTRNPDHTAALALLIGLIKPFPNYSASPCDFLGASGTWPDRAVLTGDRHNWRFQRGA